MSCVKVGLILLLLLMTWGCSIGRVYIGSEFRSDPGETIKPGLTTKSQILQIFGPPDRIQRQYDGDIFVYTFLRKNSTKFTLEEPYFTNITLFHYSKVQQKSDSLVILFDKEGTVKNYGFRKGTSELSPF
ncbi:MAG: outer membrane protein assembly factor BamE [Desulfobacterota bacterium]|nr:outer membrane protein assembly factor BamE [Thermodesulfobacteriota bacterium]